MFGFLTFQVWIFVCAVILHLNQLGKLHLTNTKFRSVEKGENYCFIADNS